jgi:peptidyl-prolyl cis-trans isomerase C
MVCAHRPWLAIVVLGLLGRPAMAQQKSAGPAPVPPPVQAPAPTGNAATVNGQPVPEKAVQRALRRVPEDKRAEARPEILNYLIDNTLIDQEMAKQRVAVDKKEVDARVEQIKAEIKKDGKDFAKVMAELMLTEEELRAQIEADLRWDKFSSQQATDQAVRKLFNDNPAMFNGSVVHARHILLTPAANNPQASEQAKVKLALIKQRIEHQVAQGLAKLDPKTDNLKREEARIKLLDTAFAEAAAKESACPSKAQGGDVGWFPRAGKMVEPFAKAAFDLKPYQLSDIVTTAFGHHLILVLETKPGKDVKFEDAKDVVKDVFCDRLRDDLLAKLRPAAQIVVTPASRP